MIEALAEIWKEIALLKFQATRTFTEGTVHEVDPKTQTARLKIGGTDKDPVLGPMVPYSQLAGALKGHVPVTKGQQMTMIAPNGDWGRATLAPMTFSEQNKSPSEKGDENVFTFGDVKIELRGKELVATIGKTVFKLASDGITQTVDGVTRKLTADGSEQTGGKVKHDGRNVGSDHKHGQVQTGPGKTGDPEA